MVKLGSKVKDSISGFKGTVTARAEYLYGCVRCGVEGKDKPGEMIWIDEQRLEETSAAKSGGSQSIPTSRDP